jgi:hypothetical protein
VSGTGLSPLWGATRLHCFDPASGVACSRVVAFAADINTEEEIVSSPVSAPPEAESPPMSFPARFLGVFISPGPTFDDIARRPGFIAPLITAVVAGLVLVETMVAKIGMERMVRMSLEQSGQAARMNAEQMEQAVRGGTIAGAVVAHVFALLGPPVVLLIYAGLGIGILVLIYGAQPKFKTVFSVTCYANLVSILGVLMGVTMVLFGDPEHFDTHNPIPSNVAFFLNPLETSKPLLSLLNSADILWIWEMVLLAIGWSYASDRRVKPLTAILPFIGLWLVWVLGCAGIAALFR